tara:strand:+ start:14515 stop:15657 length:1143 start_codon:yes stop_codon:yes gene_type:complete
MQRDTQHKRLTIADVEHLFSEPTEEVRTQIAFKVASQFDNVVLLPRERELAQEILGYLVLDISVHVRRALSSALCDLPDAPREIVLQLAYDIDEVAQPVLENSKIFTDTELAELVISGQKRRQCVIAGRRGLGIQASSAIADHADRAAVLTLVCNDGVTLQPEVIEAIITRYQCDEVILDPMVNRSDLPPRLIERVVTLVSKDLRELLIERHNIDESTARVLELQARERGLIAMLDHACGEELEALLSQLLASGKLTASLLLRAVCAGEIEFVERGFALLTNIPAERANRLIHDVGPLGFRALHARAAIPEMFYPAFRAALDVVLEFEMREEELDRSVLSSQMLAKIAPLYKDIPSNDLDLLLDRVTRAACSTSWFIRAA